MRKAELIELCDTVGYQVYDGLKKTEIEVGLDEYLSENAIQFSNDKRLAPFYKTRGRGSPVKKEIISLTSDVDSTANDDSEVDLMTTRTRSALARTPRTSALSNLSFASSVPLPPSPAVVADAIDRNTQVLRNKVAQAYEDSGVIEITQAARETLSTVVAVEFIITAFEAFYLRKEVLSDRFAFTIPPIAFVRKSSYDVWVPDLFLLLTSSFWGPTTLWASTSLIIPLIAAYFFNLTGKPTRSRSHTTHFNYTFDPLTFNIVKALLTFVIYGQDVTFGGMVDLEYVARINSALFGGWQGVLVGTGVGTLVTLYEAVLRK